MAALDWSDIEVVLIIADYFDMLNAELSGEQYNKAEHRRKLLPLLNNRNEGSIEFKHQNISAILAVLNQPYIKGYKPRHNYQKILFEKVVSKLSENPLYIVPTNQLVVKESVRTYSGRKRNYIEIDRQNKLLGNLGEEAAIEYEKNRLISIGAKKYLNVIEWVSQTRGDGLGFDILSKNKDGSDRFIEVKTTTLGLTAPIFFSKNELEFSKLKSHQYFVYRFYNFYDDRQVFIKQGPLDYLCDIEPIQFKGVLK